MSTIDQVNSDRITQVYSVFTRAMKRHGAFLSFPSGTDPKKTYSWRFLKNFVQQVEDSNIPSQTISRLVEHIVEKSSHTRNFRNGFAILNTDIKDAYQDMVIRENKIKQQVLEHVGSSHKFVQEQEESGKLINGIARWGNQRNLTNLTMWYESNSVNECYIAFSKKAYNTILHSSQLNKDKLPNVVLLHKIRAGIISLQLLTHLKEILHEDLLN